MPAIRERCALTDFRKDQEWIAARLRLKPSVRDVRHALTPLLELGLLERDNSGELRQRKSLVSSWPETQRHHIALCHRTMMKMATEIIGRFGAARVLLRPASGGTGVIAGGPVRAVLEAAGVHDVLTKTIGTNNPINVVRATMTALEQLRDPEERFAQLGRSA